MIVADIIAARQIDEVVHFTSSHGCLGTLFTKNAGTRKVFWQGPSIGYDFGGDAAKTMILVYSLNSPEDVFYDYVGVGGQALEGDFGGHCVGDIQRRRIAAGITFAPDFLCFAVIHRLPGFARFKRVARNQKIAARFGIEHRLADPL